MPRYRTHIFHIDSRDRFSYRDTTSGRYVVPTPNILRNIVSARILHVELPTSYYVFRQAFGNTTLRVSLIESGTGSTVTRDITIPDGNYTNVYIVSALLTALEEAFSTTFDCSISSTTLKLRLSEGTGRVIKIHTDTHDTLEEYSQTLAHFLGFPFEVVCEGTTLESPGLVSLNPFTYMMLDIRELHQDIHEGGTYGSRYAPGNAFAKVPIQNNTFEYSFWEPKNPPKITYTPAIPRLDRLSVVWRFHTMHEVDFNAMDHSFTIELTTEEEGCRDRDEIAEMLRSLLETPSSGDTKHINEENHIHITSPHEKQTGIPKSVMYTGGIILVCMAGYYVYARRRQM